MKSQDPNEYPTSAKAEQILAAHIASFNKAQMSETYRLFVLTHYGRLIIGVAPSRECAIKAADSGLCRLYEEPSMIPTKHNVSISEMRTSLCSMDLNRWPAANHAHIVILSPEPPAYPPTYPHA